MKFARIRSLNLLAALVLVHQLGACGCGCAEHNAWLQAADWCLGNASESPHHSHRHPRDDSAGLALQDPGHCEGEPLPVEYLRHSGNEAGALLTVCGIFCNWRLPQALPIRELVAAVDSTPPRIRLGGSAPLVLRI